MSDNKWTPYALEPMRRTMRRRRLGLGVAAALILFIGWGMFTQVMTPPPDAGGQYEILANGQQGTVEIKAHEKQERKPVTVAITPGRIVQADPPELSPPSEVQRSPAPQITPKVVAWGKLLKNFGPLLLIGSVLWFVGKGGRRASDQVNFGIYKGAMPLEMHTASHRHLVVTGRHAERSIFGKDREDYVPREAYVPSQAVPAGVVFELEDREAG